LAFIEPILIFVERDATQSSLLIILPVHCTCFGCQPHPSPGVHKTVTTGSGTDHIFCVATSLQCGQANLATLEGGSDAPKHKHKEHKNKSIEFNLSVFICMFYDNMGPDSSVTVATCYGLDGLGIESQWGRDFPHLSIPTLGPPSLLYNGCRFFPGGKAAGACPLPPTQSIAEVKERVELYLCSPLGLHSLF